MPSPLQYIPGNPPPPPRAAQARMIKQIKTFNWARLLFFLVMGASSCFFIFFASNGVVGYTPVTLCQCIIQDDYDTFLEDLVSCDIVAMYCYLGVLLLMICTFISTLLITHILFVVESIFFSFFAGIKESIGTVKDWAMLQQMLTQMLAKDSEDLSYETYGYFHTRMDARWCFKQIFRRLYDRCVALARPHPPLSLCVTLTLGHSPLHIAVGGLKIFAEDTHYWTND